MIKTGSYLGVTLALMAGLEGCAGIVVAGAATGATVAEERRSTETLYEDQLIEIKASNLIFGDDQLKENTHIGVTSIDHNVLLTGEAKDEAMHKRVVALVKGIKGVRHVVDEIAVADPASLGSRTQDAWITTKVKGELLGADGLGGLRIKVVTERGNVYLMGLVTRREGRAAADVAKSVSGVRQVVKVFEYVD